MGIPIPNSEKAKGLTIVLRLLAAVLVLIVCLALLVSAGFGVWIVVLVGHAERERDSLKVRELPVTLEDLDDWYPDVPDEENGALIYLDAFAAWEAIDPGREEFKTLYGRVAHYDRLGDYPPELVADMRAYLTTCATVREELEAALVFSRYRFPVDLTGMPDLPLSHLSDVRNAHRFWCFTSEIAAVEGDLEEAVTSHARILTTGDCLAMEPIQISQLVRLNGTWQALGALERLLKHQPLTEAQLRSLDDAYVAAYQVDGLLRTIVSERCVQATEVSRMWAGTADTSEDEVQQEMMEDLQRRPWPVRRYLANVDERMVYRAFEPLIPEEEPIWQEVLSEASHAEEIVFPRWSVSDRILPSRLVIGVSFVRDVACLRVARAAIAVERFRLAHGALPESLADCVPAFLETVPEDPFDGEALRYRFDGEGFAVYSIAQDGDDDGGTPWEKNEQDGDFVVAVAR